MTMTSVQWRHLYLEHIQSVQYFTCSSFLLQLASVKQHAGCEENEQVQQANVFRRQTLTFCISTYRQNLFKHLSHHTPVWPHERMDHCYRCIGRRNNTATRFFFINKTVVTLSKLFTLKRCIAGLTKYLSSYTGCISDWMAFALSPFAHSKQITEGCSLWDDFNSNVAISNVYKWRHSDVARLQ